MDISPIPAAASAHPFARAGYVAPYELRGAVSCYHDALEGSLFNDGSARKPCGSCDVCGTCFGDGAFWRDANGVEFKTGLTCAEKAHRDYDGATALVLSHMRKIARNEFAGQQRAAARDKRAAEYAEKVEREQEEQRAYVQTIDRAVLSMIAHPVEWRADKGETMTDYLAWAQSAGANALRAALETVTEAMQAFKVGEHTPAIKVMDVSTSQHIGEHDTFKRGARAGEVKTNKAGDPKWKRIKGLELYRLGVFHFETMYGWQTIAKFVTRDGNVVAWKTGHAGDVTNDDNKREWLKVDLTPKAHETDKYNDDKPVTWVTRVKPSS